MTPPTDIFTDQPQHAGGFLTVSFGWFPDTYPPDFGGTAHPIYGSVCATEEKREFAGCWRWESPAVQLKWPCGERKGCAGSGCQALRGEASPKSLDKPISLDERWRKAPAVRGSSRQGGRCTSHSGLPPGPFSALTLSVSVTLWRILALRLPTASVWSWLPSQSNGEDESMRKPQREAGSRPWGSQVSLSHRTITEKPKGFHLDKQVCVAGSHWKRVSACQSIFSSKDLNAKPSHNTKATVSVKATNNLVGGI